MPLSSGSCIVPACFRAGRLFFYAAVILAPLFSSSAQYLTYWNTYQSYDRVDHYLQLFDSLSVTHDIYADSSLIEIWHNSVEVQQFEFSIPPAEGYRTQVLHLLDAGLADDSTHLANFAYAISEFTEKIDTNRLQQALMWWHSGTELGLGFSYSPSALFEALNHPPANRGNAMYEAMKEAIGYLDAEGTSEMKYLVMGSPLFPSLDLERIDTLITLGIQHRVAIFALGSYDSLATMHQVTSHTGGHYVNRYPPYGQIDNYYSYIATNWVSRWLTSLRLTYTSPDCPKQTNSLDVKVHSPHGVGEHLVVHQQTYTNYTPLSINLLRIVIPDTQAVIGNVTRVPVYHSGRNARPTVNIGMQLQFSNAQGDLEFIDFEAPSGSLLEQRSWAVSTTPTTLKLEITDPIYPDEHGLLGYLLFKPVVGNARTTNIHTGILNQVGYECTDQRLSAPVIDIVPHPLIEAIPSTSICRGKSVRLVATEGFDSYEWNTGERTREIYVDESGEYFVTGTNLGGFHGTSPPITIEVFDLFTPEVIQTPANPCVGDVVQLSVDSVYQKYVWSTRQVGPSILVSEAGEYYVTVFNGEECGGQSETVIVEYQPAIVARVAIIGNDTLCEGGVVSLIARDTLDVRWSTGDTTSTLQVSEAGTYYYETISPNGCPARSDDIVIAKLPRANPQIAGPTTLCLGSTVSYTVDVEDYPSTYDWTVQGGIINGSDTSRTVGVQWIDSVNTSIRVTQSYGPCPGSAVSHISILPVWTPVVSYTSDLTACEGDSIALHAPPGYSSYSWSNGATTRTIIAKQTGLYTVTIDDGAGCLGTSDPVAVTFNALPEKPSITVEGTKLSADEAYRYQWYRNGIAIPGATSRELTAPSSGMYSIAVYNRKGCSALSDEVQVTVSHADNLPSRSNLVSLYPDPVENVLHVAFANPLSAPVTMIVYNIMGAEVERTVFEPTDGILRLSTAGYLPGVYFLRVTLGGTTEILSFRKR
ncbi:MAG: hypothetical protein CL946_03350 [Ectothiorhodospiraceae bacterium]|nr:hypothetical protein [Ectothiorhodospiraceae bacterium]